MGDPVRVRFPTLEIYGQTSGAAFSSTGRSLNERETDIARFVFEQSIDLDVVRIVTATVAAAPTTLGNNIRTSGQMSDATLVHELAHIWQYQNLGSAYISDSLWHQAVATVTTGSRNGAYEPNVTAGRAFTDYQAEQQATIVERWYSLADFRNNALYQVLVDQVRAARPLAENVRRMLFLEEAAYGPGMGHQRLGLGTLPGGPGSNGNSDFFLGGAGIPQIRIEFNWP